jgi:hypothetical protein
MENTSRPTNRAAKQLPITIGSRVSFIASGKGARMDGINGQRVTGTITSFFEANDVIVAVDQSSFVGTIVPFKKLRLA